MLNSRSLVPGALLFLLLSGCSLPSAPPPAPPPDFPQASISLESERVDVTVPEGALLSEIAASLESAGVIASSRAFLKEASASPDATRIRPGKYSIPVKISSAQALDALLGRGEAASTRLVVFAGSSVTETLKRISEVTKMPLPDLEAAASPEALGTGSSLEGWLAPGGYDVLPGMTPEMLLAQMVARQRSVLAEFSAKDPYALLTAASIVQEEVIPSDFPKAARAIKNRLDAGMPLQMDSTLNYLRPDPTLQLTKKELEAASPYNTHRNRGLPPTPVSSPSREALAAMHAPPAGDWVYFVLMDTAGNSFFTSSYDEFLAAKKQAKEEGVF